MEHQVIVSCLGRPIELGMLYDCRSETPVPGVTLWDQETLRSKSDIKPRESCECEVTSDDSMENKTRSMKIEANVKLAFLGGLLNVEGAAKYLNNQRSSANQARVVLRYSCTSSFEQLTMSQLAVENIMYPETLDNDMATNVVTAIEYGADFFFVFDRQLSSSENSREVEGKLQVSLAKLPGVTQIGAGGAVNANFEKDEKTFANSFKCTFYGDIRLEKNPTNFEEAMNIYKDLPALIRKSSNRGIIYGVPKKAYLYPLSKLDNRDAKVVRSISDNVVNESQLLLESIAENLASANDLENSDICQKFKGIQQQVAKFKVAMIQFRASFQRTLREMLPRIRNGGTEEGELLKKIQQIKKSPYDPRKLFAWVNFKKREFSCLQSYLKALEGFSLAFQPGELEQFTQNENLKYVLCISFGNITRSEHPYLDSMTEFSLNNEGENDVDSGKAREENWCDNENITTNIRNQIRLFRDFATANNDRNDLKFVVLDKATKRNQGKTDDVPGTIYLYKEGRRQLFQPPSAPGQPRTILNDGYITTISWPAPVCGAEYILFYRIFYKSVRTASNNWSQVETTSPESQFTFTQLVSETEYFFKIEAIAEPGKSQLSPQSQKIKTGSRFDRLANLILPKCQLIKKGRKGQPSWYQSPGRTNSEWRMKLIEIGEISSDSPAEDYKIVLLVGGIASGKSTLISGMINYLYGVRPDDPFRLQQTPMETDPAQLNDITEYVLHWHPRSRVPYSLVLVETPGYDDMRGYDELINQLRVFLNQSSMINHIDAVGIVVRSAEARLTNTQEFVFDGVFTSLFGKDIKKNIFLMLTFTNDNSPPILAAIDDLKIPYESYFTFDNSVFTRESTVTGDAIYNRAWDLAFAAYQAFFDKLGATTWTSLKLTREVLQERQNLGQALENLSLTVNMAVIQMKLMSEEAIEYEAKRNACQGHSDSSDVRRSRNIDCPAVSCVSCSLNCHDPSRVRCVVFGWDGRCKICNDRCSWHTHFKNGYFKKCFSADDMQRKRDDAKVDLFFKEFRLLHLFKRYNKVRKDILKIVESIRTCSERLDEIDLRPTNLNYIVWIDFLINVTKLCKLVGWEMELYQLENVRQCVAMIEEMREKGQNYDPFVELQNEIEKLETEGIEGFTAYLATQKSL